MRKGENQIHYNWPGWNQLFHRMNPPVQNSFTSAVSSILMRIICMYSQAKKHRVNTIHTQFIYDMRVKEIDGSSGEVDSSCGIAGSKLVRCVLFDFHLFSLWRSWYQIFVIFGQFSTGSREFRCKDLPYMAIEKQIILTLIQHFSQYWFEHKPTNTQFFLLFCVVQQKKHLLKYESKLSSALL